MKGFAAIILIIVAALQLFMVGCEKKDRSEIGSFAQLDEYIADSITEGRLSGARSLVDKELAKAGNDSDRYYMVLAQKCVVEYYSGEAAKILTISDSVLRYAPKAEKRVRDFMEGKTYSTLAGYYRRYQFNPDSNIYYYKKGLDCLRRVGELVILTNAYGNLAGAYRDNGDLVESAKYYQQGIHVADSCGLDAYAHLPLYTGLASTYTSLRDFQQSEIWYEKAAKEWDEMDVNDRFFYLNNRGNDYYLQKRYAESLGMFVRLDSLLRKNPELEWERNFCKANMTDIYLQTGKPEEAASLLDSTLYYFTVVQPNPYVMLHLDTQKLRLYLLEGKTEEARRLVAEWERPGSHDRAEQAGERLEVLKDYYASTGRWKEAYGALESFMEHDDSVRNATLKLSIEETKNRYERDSNLQALRKELELQKELSTRNYFLIGIGGLLICVLVILVIMIRKMAAHREERMLHRIVDLRIKSTRSRITPHFIYNALNHQINASGEKRPENMEALVRLLRHQQFMVDELGVKLSDDIEFVNDYVDVMRGGMNRQLDYKLEIGPGIDPDSITVPSMCVQIFVENAFKHGFAHLPEQSICLLRISVEKEGDFIMVNVFNNASPDYVCDGKSSCQGFKIIYGTLEILNSHKIEQITTGIEPWTDNPEGSGYRAWLRVPVNFNFDHGKN